MVSRDSNCYSMVTCHIPSKRMILRGNVGGPCRGRTYDLGIKSTWLLQSNHQLTVIFHGLPTILPSVSTLKGGCWWVVIVVVTPHKILSTTLSINPLGLTLVILKNTLGFNLSYIYSYILTTISLSIILRLQPKYSLVTLNVFVFTQRVLSSPEGAASICPILTAS